jgi:hypothetical protein
LGDSWVRPSKITGAQMHITFQGGTGDSCLGKDPLSPRIGWAAAGWNSGWHARMAKQICVGNRRANGICIRILVADHKHGRFNGRAFRIGKGGRSLVHKSKFGQVSRVSTEILRGGRSRYTLGCSSVFVESGPLECFPGAWGWT